MKSKLFENKYFKPFFNNRYSFLAAGCTIFIMLIVYFCYDLIPFGDKTILRMDLYHQYGPLFAELYERVTNLDSFLYSWTSGGGGTFLGNFFNYLSSPFAIVMLLAGHKNMPEAIAIMILLKAATASYTFSYFIKEKYKPEASPLISAFGVLYACSGYFIAYYWNVMWIDAFYLFPLVMLGIDKIINNRKCSLYIASLTLTFITNYYMAYMVCIFSVIFFLYDYITQYTLTETYLGRLKEREHSIKGTFSWAINNLRNNRFFDSGCLFAFSSIISACLSAFALLPVFYVLQNCSATSGTFPTELKTYFSIFDFLANHLAYLDPTIRSSGDDVLPNVYCGVLTVMLVPLYIFSTKISNKEKVFSCGVLAFMFASCYTNYLNYIWHGFHFPNDLPYRFSYMYSFMLLILAFKALTFIKEYTNRQLIGVGTATVFFVIMVQEIGSKNFSELGVWISIAFIGIYCLALGILKNDQYPKIAAAALILCSCTAEYIVANTNNYSMDQPKTSFVSDYDDFKVIKNKLDEYNNGDDSYRMELTSLRARMDPCWYYYNGLSTFSSMAYEKVSNMQYHLGMFSNYINSYTYNKQTPIYNAFFALDYIVDNSQGSTAEMNDEYYERLFSKSKYTAYKNNYSLPIAFRANEEIEYWSHDNSNPFEVQSALFETATGINNVFSDIELDKITTNNTTCNYDGYGDSGCYPFTISGDSADASLTYELTVKESGNAYIYFKTGANSVDRITITLSDRALSQAIDTKPYILDLGYLQKGDKISIYAPISNGTSGYTYLYAVSLNDEAFKEGYNALKREALKVTNRTETEINGTINVLEDGIIYTSINFDTGWDVFIDGNKVNDEDLVVIGEALLGVRATKGEHTITFKYTPDGLVLGAIVSILALITLIILFYVKKLKVFKFNPPLYEEVEIEEVPEISEITNTEISEDANPENEE